TIIKGDARILDSIVGHVVSLLPVAHARAESELEASVEKLFDEGGRVRIVAEENVTAERPRRLRKKRQAITDAGGSSHPPKKLRGDYGTSSEVAICGKSPSALRELLASSLLIVEVGVVAVPTLPMVTSSVSATPEHESGAPIDSITRPNFRTVGASERFVISLDSSHHSSTHASEAEGDSFIKSDVVPLVMTEAVVTSHAVDIPPVQEMGVKVTSFVRTSLFQDSDSTYIVKADIADPSYSAKQDLSMGSQELNYETLMRTEYCLSKRKRLEFECEKQADLLKVRDAKIESLKAQLLLKETEAVEAVHLRARVSASEVTEKKHAIEIDSLKQNNVALENEKGSLDGKVVELQSLVSTKDLDLKELNDVVSSRRSQKDGLVSQVHDLEVTCFGLRERLFGYKNLTDQLEEFQDAQLKVVNDKVAKLDADLAKMAYHLKEKFHPHLLTTISDQREKRSLTDVAAYNPSTEADFNSDLQELRKLDYPLLSKLKSHKDESVKDIMNLLLLEGPLFDAPVLKVGMPISTRITAFVPYVSENGVFSLLDLIIVRYFFDGEFFKSAGERPAIKASYSASLLVELNMNLRAYVNSIPFGFVIIRPAPEPSMHDDPSLKSIYGSESSSLSSMGVSGGSLFGCYTSSPLTDVLGL
nr:hypothetical protein [Tanacetum cinerariifolium]